MDTPYYVEDDGKHGNKMQYALRSSADGTVVVSSDLVLLHKIADLLNEDVSGRDIHR